MVMKMKWCLVESSPSRSQSKCAITLRYLNELESWGRNKIRLFLARLTLPDQPFIKIKHIYNFETNQRKNVATRSNKGTISYHL